MACRSIFFQNNKNPEEVGSQMARSSECVDKANFLEQFVLIRSIGCAMCTLIGSFLLARECTSECISSGCWAHFSDSQCHHVSSCDGSSWQQNTTVIIAFPVTSVTFRGVSMLLFSSVTWLLWVIISNPFLLHVTTQWRNDLLLYI